jgi:DNA repair exonuclease SbcCD ATPase subunit
VNAAELMERGEKAEAQRLIQEVLALSAKAEAIEQREKAERLRNEAVSREPLKREHELQRLHARLKELQMAHRDLWASDAPDGELTDIRFQIRKVEELIAAKLGKRSVAPPHEGLQHVEKVLQRVEHLRAAAEHLQAADVPDLAHNLRERSQDMERQARAMLEEIEKQSASLPSAPPPPGSAEALREEVQALRKELEALRKQRQQ